MTPKERERARTWAREFWYSLSPAERGEVGDALVLGYWDWRDWFDDPPPRGFTRELDYIRLHESDEV
jgi:hypothetical protein